MIQRPLRLHGFSVLELLVVVAIIGVLAAIIVPLGARMKEGANQVGCVNNLRTIGTAITSFAIERKGFLPGPSLDIVEIGKGHAISGMLSAYLEPKITDSVWECPGNPKIIARNREALKTNTSRNSSYTTHWPFYGYTYQPPKESLGAYRLSDIKERERSDQWLLRDIDFWNYPMAERIGGEYPPVHNGGRNHLLADCTVEWVQVAPK